MDIRKVALVIPNMRWFGHRYWPIYPYAVCLIAAVLRERYEVMVLDLNLDDCDFDTARRLLAETRADVVGISLMAAEYRDCAHKVAALAKEALPEAIVLLGGVYATALPAKAIADPNIDYAVLGEGEEVVLRLLEALQGDDRTPDIDGVAYMDAAGNPMIRPQIHYIQNLDAVPLPAFDLVPMARYMRTVESFSHVEPRRTPFAKMFTSRGCPNRCSFCDLRSIQGKKFRPRSAGNVLAEIDWLVAAYGVREIVFNDDNLVADRKRAEIIFQELIERKYDLQWKPVNIATYALDEELLEMMAAAGCYQLTLAIESGSDRVLSQLMRKPLKTAQVGPVVRKAKELGMEVAGLFILGMPGETWEEIRQTVAFAEELDLDYSHFGIATPMPNTDLLKRAQQENLLVDGFDVANFEWSGYGRGVIRTSTFDPFDLEVLRVYEWDRINFKNEEKKAKIARMIQADEEYVQEWRKKTRESIVSRYTGRHLVAA